MNKAIPNGNFEMISRLNNLDYEAEYSSEVVILSKFQPPSPNHLDMRAFQIAVGYGTIRRF